MVGYLFTVMGLNLGEFGRKFQVRDFARRYDGKYVTDGERQGGLSLLSVHYLLYYVRPIRGTGLGKSVDQDRHVIGLTVVQSSRVGTDGPFPLTTLDLSLSETNLQDFMGSESFSVSGDPNS